MTGPGAGAHVREEGLELLLGVGRLIGGQHEPERPVEALGQKSPAGRECAARYGAVEVHAGAQLPVHEHRLARQPAAVRVPQDPDRGPPSHRRDELPERLEHQPDVEQPSLERGLLVGKVARERAAVGLLDPRRLVRMVESGDGVSGGIPDATGIARGLPVIGSGLAPSNRNVERAPTG